MSIVQAYKNNFADFLSIKDFAYFLMAPTLCYQLWYPRTPQIRPWFVVRRAIEFICLFCAQVFILLQYIYPLLEISPKIFLKADVSMFEVVAFVE